MSYTGKTIDLSKYDKYGKEVELSKVEVQLNKVQDLMKTASKIGGSIMSKEADILGIATDINKEAEKYNSIISEMTRLEKSAKELGIDSLVKEASEAVAFYKAKIKRADSMLNSIKGAIKR